MSSTKRKAPPVRIARPQTTQNAKHASKPQINESRTSVVNVPKHQQKSKKKAAGEAIEISSDEESDNDAVDEDDLMDEDEPAAAPVSAETAPKTNGHANGSSKNVDDNDDNDDEDEDGDHEPTFGDLVREHETVDVAAALSLLNPADDAAANGDVAAPATPGKAATSNAAAPTLASLGHLLNAALRSGDDANLEVCFNTTTDATWVRNTIQRLDPSLAGTLLQKLAARIHRRPGRAHTLVGWVQWTLITHGGALLANQAGVTRALQELHRVLEERARGLNSLLLLKGKLDMLEAQMQMRRLQRAGGLSSSGLTSGVATVGSRVGSKAVDSVNNLGRAGGARGAGRRRRGGAGAGGARGGDFDEDDVVTYDEDLDDEDDADISGQILVNSAGVAGESFIADSDEEALDEDDDDNSEDDDEEGGVEDDDDLEEMDDDEAGEDDEVDFDDVDDDDEDDDEDDEDEQAAAPPPKLQKKSGGAFSKRR